MSDKEFMWALKNGDLDEVKDYVAKVGGGGWAPSPRAPPLGGRPGGPQPAWGRALWELPAAVRAQAVGSASPPPPRRPLGSWASSFPHHPPPCSPPAPPRTPPERG